MSETQGQCNTREEFDIIPIAARQSFSRSSTDNLTPVISQTLQLPPSNDTEPIVRQEMTELPILRASTATINQVVSFPIQSRRYASTNKRGVHDLTSNLTSFITIVAQVTSVVVPKQIPEKYQAASSSGTYAKLWKLRNLLEKSSNLVSKNFP